MDDFEGYLPEGPRTCPTETETETETETAGCLRPPVLRRAYKRTDIAVYTLSAPMSRTPVEFVAKAKNAAPKPKGH